MKSRIIITGNIPSKKNSKRLFRNSKTGKTFITSSKNAKDFEFEWCMRLKNKYPTYNHAKVKIGFYAKDKRKFDLTNKTESIMDVLVRAGILVDDNYSVVPIVLPMFMGLDKDKKGFAIIEIESIDEPFEYQYYDINLLA